MGLCKIIEFLNAKRRGVFLDALLFVVLPNILPENKLVAHS